MKYIVTLTLSNDNQIRAKINGHNESDAVKNLQHHEKVIEFLHNSDNIEASISDIKVEPLQPRYDFRCLADGSCSCLDTKYGYYITWQRGQYNTTGKAERFQKMERYADFDTTPFDELGTATHMREMGEWIATFHYDEAMNTGTCMNSLSEKIKAAMQYSGVDEVELSEQLGQKLNRVHACVECLEGIKLKDFYNIVRALGAEIKIVFPEDE